MSSNVKMKTITSHINDVNTKRIMDHMTKISKNVYNCTIYCITIFEKYKQIIFKEIYSSIKNVSFEKNYDKTILETKFYELYEKKYNQYQNTICIIKNNNEIIYKFIKEILINVELNNDNYFFYRHLIIYNILKNKNIIFNDTNKKEVVIDIIDNILKNRYIRLYYEVKNKIDNKIPIKGVSKCFIDNVMKKEFIFKDVRKPIDWKKKIENKLPMITKDGKDIKNKLISDNNIIGRVTYSHLGDNKDQLPSDVIINIIQKAYKGYVSFYALRNKGIKANKPKYLNKNGHFNLQYFTGAGMKIITINNKSYLRLITGKYVADNYEKIISNNNLVCLNEKNERKLYINKTYLRKVNKNTNKQKNFIIIINNTKYYVPKNHKKIIDAYNVYVELPNKIPKNSIKLVEIKPLYDDHGYKCCIVYESENTLKVQSIDNSKPEISENDSISIDLGVASLMTIYNPTGIQYIVDGKYLVWLNSSYNELISKLKRDANTINDKYTSKRIQDLLIERENKINDHFNMIVKWMSTTYSDKKLIIIGYNTNWKKGVSMGKKNNRNFYQIPYCKLLDKLKNNMMQNGINVRINEESYTSKCDSLVLEEVKKHNNYCGKRIKRGLYQSSIGKLINADLNGAINIMRKYFSINGYNITQIKGKDLFNPVRANINCDA